MMSARRSAAVTVLAVVVVAEATIAAAPFAAAATPSFDCEKARTPVERAICEDDALAALDLELARAFATVLAKAPAHAVNELKDSQAVWRKGLLDCGKSADIRACVIESYQQRLGAF